MNRYVRLNTNCSTLVSIEWRKKNAKVIEISISLIINYMQTTRYTHIADHRNVPRLSDDRFGMARVAFRAENHGHFVANHLSDRLGRVHRVALRVVPFQRQRHVGQQVRVVLDLLACIHAIKTRLGLKVRRCEPEPLDKT